MPKDSIRLPIILLVLGRIRSESQIWKITGHGYRGERSANDTWSTVILGSFFTFPAFIYLALKLRRSDRWKLYSCYVKYVKNAADPKFELPNQNYQVCSSNYMSSAQTSLPPPSFPGPTGSASFFAPIVDRMHMDAISSISPYICFIRLSSKEPEVFCTRAKTSIGLICIDVGEFDQFRTLSFSRSSFLLPLPCHRSAYISHDIRYR